MSLFVVLFLFAAVGGLLLGALLLGVYATKRYDWVQRVTGVEKTHYTCQEIKPAEMRRQGLRAETGCTTTTVVPANR